MNAAVRFRQNNVARQNGERGRLKVVQGPDYGSVFVMFAPRITLGRGEDNDVIISDLKASRNHAEISYGANGWQIKDLGSSNGIFHNGKNTRSAPLRSNDSVTIGETTLEFIASDVATQMLAAPARSIEQIQAEQAALQAQKQKVRNLGKPGLAGLAGGGLAQAGPSKRNPTALILVVVGAVAVVLFMMPDPPAKTAAGPKKDPERDLASFLPPTDPGVARTADTFFRAGFREYRERNYLRAKVQFETVLQMNPTHHLATIYLENCNQSIKDDVKREIDQGNTDFQSGKLRSARGHFESVLRSLFRDVNNPDYIQAKDSLDKVNTELRKGSESS